jgi:hypothetical protein
MTSPGAVAGYKMEYSAYSGRELGVGVHEREWKLKLDSSEGTVQLEKHRSDADQAGEPVGLFQSQLPAETFVRLRQLAAQVRLAELPPPSGGGLGVALFTIKIEQGTARLEKPFTGRDMAAMQRLRPLLDELNRIYSAMNNSPVAAVRAVVVFKPREYRFEWELVNIGRESVCVGDPRFILKTDPKQGAYVRVAEFPEERPGFTSPPLVWEQVRLAPAVQVSGFPLTLKAGEKLALSTVGWPGARAGVRYIAQAVWLDYSGMREGPGCYRVRGAAFSESIEFTLK